MNILENKRVTALSAVFLLAFGGTMYYGYSCGQKYNQVKAELADMSSKMEDFESAKIPPTAANAKIVAAAAKQVEDLKASLQKQMDAYEAACIGEGRTIDGVGLQNKVRKAIAEVAQLASEKGCNIARPAADLGMGDFKQNGGDTADAPPRGFMADASKHVAEILINSGVSSVEKIYCDTTPLPKPGKGAKKAAPYYPMSMEVAFRAKRSTVTDGKTPESLSPLPRVLNAITTDKTFFIIPTGIGVESLGNVPGIDAYSAPETNPAVAEDGGEAAPEAREIAKRKTGDPNEEVHVHLNLQVLYFPGKGDK